MQSFRFDKSSFWPSLPKSQVIFFLACHKPFIDDRFLLVEGLWTYMVNCTSGWSIYSPLCNFKIIPGFYFEITQCRLTWLAWSVTQHMCLQAFSQSKTNCQPKAWDGVPCISANQATCCHPPWVLWFHRPIVMWSDMWLQKVYALSAWRVFSTSQYSANFFCDGLHGYCIIYPSGFEF